MTERPHPRRKLASVIEIVTGILLLVPAVQPLLTAAFTCGYDNVFHLWRAVQVEHLLRQGVLFSRWAPDMAHGFGFPLFVFVSPASAYVAALLHLAGLHWPVAVNATFALGMALGGLFTYLLARDLFGRRAGLVAAVAYVYAPYQAYEAFNRGSLWEAFAWAFPPLVLWALHRWLADEDPRFLALGSLSLAALILTHQLFAFLFSPLLLAWVLLESYLTRKRKTLAKVWHPLNRELTAERAEHADEHAEKNEINSANSAVNPPLAGILRGALLGLLALGLSAFFWLPGLAERGWVQTGRLLGTWVFDYNNNFLDLRQLLAPPRPVDTTLINDWPPKALGLVPVLAALLPLARWRRLDRVARWRVGLLLASAVGFALLTLPISRPLWDHLPLLPYVQFPWRFLAPAVLCCALLTGATFTTNQLTNQLTNHLPTILILILVLSSLGWFYPDHCAPPGDMSVTGMIAWERATHTLGTTAKGEYLPIWVQRFPTEPSLDADYVDADCESRGPIDRLPQETLPSGARIISAQYTPLDGKIELESRDPFQARYLAFYYPGWWVTIDGRQVNVTPSDPEGFIAFDVPPGHHTIHVHFGETPLRLAADVLSIISLALLILITTRYPALKSGLPRLIRRNPILIGITLATLLFLLAIALNLSPYLRGPDDWRWAAAVPGRVNDLWSPVLALMAYLVLAWAAVRQMNGPSPLKKWQRRGLLFALVLAVPLMQTALLGSEPLRALFYRTVSVGSSGIFSVGTIIEDAGDFVRRYPELMPTLSVHPQRYPPGLPLLVHLTRRALEQVPALADAIGFYLRRYQCHDMDLMRLPNAAIGSAVLQMALPLLSGFTLIPLYGLARRVYGERVAVWTVALYPLVPSFALWAGRWDQFYPLLTCTAWYFFHVGLTQPRRVALLAAGLTLSVASFLSFGLLALLLPMGLFALMWVFSDPEHYRDRWKKLLLQALLFLGGLAAPWIAYRLAFGTGLLDIWRVSMSYHLGLGRSYWTWLVYHLYDFGAFLGLPLSLLLLVALFYAARDLKRRRWDPLALSFGLGILLLDLSGMAQGEVARVWIFLTPLAVLVACRGSSRIAPTRLANKKGELTIRPTLFSRFALVALLLALQLFTFNTFLRVVTTGLSDPPSRTPVFEPPPTIHRLDARFSVENTDAAVLLGYDLEPAAPGDTLHLTLYWQALAPMARPYSVFTHLIGPDGALISQQDNMPLRNNASTTCWVPGEVIADPYDIPIDAQAAPGEYSVATGLYFWMTGERLPVSGPTVTPDNRVMLSPIPIGEGER